MKVVQAFSWALFALFVIGFYILFQLVGEARKFGRHYIWEEPIRGAYFSSSKLEPRLKAVVRASLVRRDARLLQYTHWSWTHALPGIWLPWWLPRIPRSFRRQRYHDPAWHERCSPNYHPSPDEFCASLVPMNEEVLGSSLSYDSRKRMKTT
jgi:hypothetical protein